jgi:hypothetical protein
MLFDFEYLLDLHFGIHRNRPFLALIHLVTLFPLLWALFGTVAKISPVATWTLAVAYAAYSMLLEPIAGAIFSLALFAFVHYAQITTRSLEAGKLVFGLTCLLLLQLVPLTRLKNGFCSGNTLCVFILFEAFYFCMRSLFALGYRPLLRQKISVKRKAT